MSASKISIRPVIEHIGTPDNKSPEEKFQNLTLRPIIKLQHELLVSFFENYLRRKKIDFTGVGSVKQEELVSKIFRNDNMFKAELRGLIIGLFSQDEFVMYLEIASETNKRMYNMIKERLLSVFL